MNARKREAVLGEILQVISRSRADEGPVLQAILENACHLCDAPLALLPMVENNRIVIRAHRGASPKFIEALNEISLPLEDMRIAVVRAITTGEVVEVPDAASEDLYRDGVPFRAVAVELEGVRTIVVVPMMSEGTGVGGILLYRREVRPFAMDQIAILKTFAEQAVIAIENVRQFRALEDKTAEVRAQAKELRDLNKSLESRVEKQVDEIERMGRLKRFLPAAVADTVISSGADQMLSSHRALLGVLFCDIRGFTAFCETAEPEETIEVLQTYHEEMGKQISVHGAGVDHRMGDGIMVLFNDPLPCDDPAGDAARLAISMRARMTELCLEWKRLGHRLGFGVGVSLGYATVGMVGYEGRYDYTASGTAVNLAARLCDQAEDGDILLSPRAYSAIQDDFGAVSRGEVILKGIHAPVEVFRLTEVD